jgi:hypothetical protein
MGDMNSRYQRLFSVVSDIHGVDPLLDRLVPLITQIKTWTPHEVTQDERGAPDLISLREYRSDEFWWILMAYNGISSYRDLVEGKMIKIPNMSAVITIVTDNAIRPSRVQRTITI